MKKGTKYTVYLSGWVCQGDKYIFRIDDEQILNYILSKRWAREKLDYLLDNYPDSFLEMFEENERERLDNAIDALAKSLQE